MTIAPLEIESPRASARDVIILVVDDNPLDRVLAGGLLARGACAQVEFASNGKLALEKMAETTPDLVVTDLQMPELSGLEFVEAMKLRYPAVPAVLMTAHGSEEVALAALQRGAASYVPKQQLAQRLVETVQEVLAVSHAGRRYMQFVNCWRGATFQFELDNDPAVISALVRHIQDYETSMAAAEEGSDVRIGVALQEAIRNAMFHGNLELDSCLRSESPTRFYAEAELRRVDPRYRDRRVKVTVIESPLEARYIVADEGRGFDPAAAPDPTLADNAERPWGRGLFLIRMFMDEVLHNAIGNEITMIRRRGAPSPPAATPEAA